MSDLKLSSQSLGEDDSPPLVLLPFVAPVTDGRLGSARSDPQRLPSLAHSESPTSLHWSESFCQTLARSGCRIIRYAHRSVGATTELAVESLEQHLETLWAVADAHDLPEFHLAGMSLGGLIAQLAALQNPNRIRSLILMASAPLSDASSAVLSKAFLSAAARGSSVVLSEALPSTPAGCSSALYPGPADAKTYADQMEKLSMPVLILHGDQDPIVPLACGELLAKALPNARLHVLRGVGHELPEARMPEILTEVLNFLAEQHR